MSTTIGPAAAPGAEGSGPLPVPAAVLDARPLTSPALPDPVWGRDSRRGRRRLQSEACVSARVSARVLGEVPEDA